MMPVAPRPPVPQKGIYSKKSRTLWIVAICMWGFVLSACTALVGLTTMLSATSHAEREIAALTYFDADGLPRDRQGLFSWTEMDDSMPKVAEFTTWYKATYPQYVGDDLNLPSRYVVSPMVKICNAFIAASPSLEGYQNDTRVPLTASLSEDKATWGPFVAIRIATGALKKDPLDPESAAAVNPADAQVIAEKGVSIFCPFIEDLEPLT